MDPFPQHASDQSTWGRFARTRCRCDGCGRDDVEIVGYWGETQERRLCATCDENAWRALMREITIAAFSRPFDHC